MRDIKFRAWSQDGEMINHDLLFNNQNPFNRVDLELMQWTGLKDKNKKMIFEGDIVRAIARENYSDDTKISDIIFDCSGGWVIRSGKECPFGLPIEWGGWESVEVIGNVWENPELLKEGK